MMFENLEEEAYKLLKEFRRISPHLLMRRFHLTGEMARILCLKVWMRQHKEARVLIKGLEG